MVEIVRVDHAFCVSDLHIVHSNDEVARRFREFLRTRVAARPDSTLVIVGDLLHFWFGRRNFVPEEFRELIDDLEELPRVIWVEGNHDLRLERALGPGSRIRVVRGSMVLEHAGGQLHVEHGHRVDRSNRGELLLDRILQTPLADLGSALLTRRGTQSLGLWAAQASAGGEGSYDGRDPHWLRAALELASSERRRGMDLTVLGHGHYLGWWSEGLVCLGDWLHWNSYLELEPSGSRVIRRFEPQLSGDPPVAGSPLGEIPR